MRRATALACAAALILPSAAATAAFPLGATMTPAHHPNYSLFDVVSGVWDVAKLGDHASVFWRWPEGDSGLSTAQSLTGMYQTMGKSVTIQMNVTNPDSVSPPPGVAGTSFSDQDVRSRYLADVERVASFHPDYMNLAAEINLFTSLAPAGEYAAFQSLYAEAYSRAKAISPQTQVGLSYHLDMLYKDMNFGMPGEFGPHDFIGISSYPSWLVSSGLFESVDAIPAEYYAWLRDWYPDEPIVFTEIGWPSGGRSSPQQQAAFVAELPRLLGPLDIEFALWPALHDATYWLSLEQLRMFGVDAEVLFAELNSMGLKTSSGAEKPAYAEAMALSEPMEHPVDPVPEPSSLLVLATLGLAGTAVRARRRGRPRS